MPFMYGIKFRLQLLLLSSIILVLAVVGIALAQLIEQFHLGAAQQQFDRAFAAVNEELALREVQMQNNLRTLVQRDDLISSVNMIHQYATVENYQPLIYDVEKQHIADILRNQARAGDVGQLAVYDGRGSLLAFFSTAEAPVSGYVSWQDRLPVVYLRAEQGASAWQRGPLPQTLELERDPAQRSAPMRYRRSDHGFVQETAQPVVRAYPDGSMVSVGAVTATNFVTQDFAEAIQHKSGVEFAVLFDDGSRLGALHDVLVNQMGAAPLLREDGTQAVLPPEHADYFLSVRLLPLEREAKAYMVVAARKAVVQSEIRRTQTVLLAVLLLSALVIIPVGTWAANRAISRPVHRLVEGAEAIEHGDYGRRVAVESRDELGRLGNAFNGMAEAVQSREHALRESERLYRLLVDNLPQRVFFKGTDFSYVSCNRQYADDLGVAQDDIRGKTDFDFFPRELAEAYRSSDRQVLDSGGLDEREEPYLKNGETLYIHTVKTPLRDEQGNIMGILGIFWDVTAQRALETQLRQAAAVFESTAEGVVIIGVDGRIVAVNNAFVAITGYAQQEVSGETLAFLHADTEEAARFQAVWPQVHQTGQWQGEARARRKDGEAFPQWLTVSAVRDERGAVTHYVLVFTDITVLKRSQQQLDHLAHHDPLTDLPNRVLFNMRLTHALSHARRSNRRAGVLFIDLDRFKDVNDTLGHPVGDMLLQQVAHRFQKGMRETDTIARTGGDEFIVIVEEADTSNDLAHVAQKLLDVFQETFHIGGNDIHLGASIGISVFPDDGADAETLVKNSDIAMYRAKERGRNNYQFYTAALTANAVERFQLETALRQALDRDELLLYYQPKVSLADGKPYAVEALVRWRHPELGLVAPDRFIPLAEDTGLIQPIGVWVLRTACKQMKQWLDQGLPLEHVAVNLSGVQILRGGIVTTVWQVLQETGLAPQHLELEITESVIMEHAEETIRVLDELRELGVTLAIDDFGTGYSSLSYLKRFPIDTLKVDRSFVQDIPDDANDAAIIRAVIALGRSLQLDIVAEGVETAEQQAFLLQEGCATAQGYLFSKPVPASWITESLQKGGGTRQT
jgi:diguanylate cyclase (GGDEF)-like protein/PAS domain S-box-containing protein